MPRNSSSSQAVSAAAKSIGGGASGKLANAAGGLFRGTEGRVCTLAGQRYSPLVVIKTTAWPVPCQQTRKFGQMLPYKRERLYTRNGVLQTTEKMLNLAQLRHFAVKTNQVNMRIRCDNRLVTRRKEIENET